MGPHLDYHQDDEERKRFYEEYSFPEFIPMNQSEVHALVGRLDTEDEKLGVILGLWKPLSPSEVYNYRKGCCPMTGKRSAVFGCTKLTYFIQDLDIN